MYPEYVDSDSPNGAWVNVSHRLNKHSVLRTLDPIITDPVTPTPVKTALENILAIMTQQSW